MWTGETEGEYICHKDGHDLIATSEYFWAKPRLGRLIWHHPKNSTYRVWGESLQPFPVPASHLFFLRHCCSPFPGNSGQDLGCLPPSSSQNSKNAWEKATDSPACVREMIQSPMLVISIALWSGRGAQGPGSASG